MKIIMVWWLMIAFPSGANPSETGVYRTENECKWAGEFYKDVRELKITEYSCRSQMLLVEDKK